MLSQYLYIFKPGDCKLNQLFRSTFNLISEVICVFPQKVIKQIFLEASMVFDYSVRLIFYLGVFVCSMWSGWRTIKSSELMCLYRWPNSNNFIFILYGICDLQIYLTGVV